MYVAKTYGVRALHHQGRFRDKYRFLATVFELFRFVSEMVFGFDRLDRVFLGLWIPSAGSALSRATSLTHQRRCALQHLCVGDFATVPKKIK